MKRLILSIILTVLLAFPCHAMMSPVPMGQMTDPAVETFCKRVQDDGGTVVDHESASKLVKLIKQSGVWGNVKFLADANFAVKLNSGVSVQTLYDLSGNNNDATQATVDKQPVWTAGVQNGKYGMSFDGTNDFLATTPDATIKCIFGVAKTGPVISTYHTIFNAADDSDNSNVRMETGTPTYRAIGNEAVSSDFVWDAGTVMINSAVGYTITVEVTHLLYEDNANAQTLGSIGGAFLSRYWKGDVDFATWLDIVPSTTQRTALDTFIGHSYYAIY